MQDKLLIKGGTPLSGEVEISGYKNSAGACLAAVLLSKKTSTIDNLPLVSDVLDQIEILKRMGIKIEWLSERKIKITPETIEPEKIPADLFEKMRVSVLLSALSLQEDRQNNPLILFHLHRKLLCPLRLFAAISKFNRQHTTNLQLPVLSRKISISLSGDSLARICLNWVR